MNKILNFERILCPVAQSHESDEGLRYAILIARSYGARLSVLTCNDASSPGDETVEAMRTGIKRAIEHSFVSFPGSKDGVRLDWDLMVVSNNRPEEAIKREAVSQNVDLIVMGSRRRSVPSIVVLGSTAEAVCRTAPCSVLVARLAARRDAAKTNGKLELKKLLVATDFSRHSELALQYGLSLAQEYQSELHLLHIITGARSTEAEISWTSQDAEGPYHAAARRLHGSVPAEVHLWSDVTNAVREGKVYREIVSYVVEKDIDLICIGAHGQGFTLGTLFGSNTDRVLRQAPCPVLVTRPVASEASSNGFERTLNHNVDVKRMKDTEDTTMPDPIARKRLKKRMLDRWENEGGSIAADTTADAGGPTGEDRGRSKKRSSPSDKSPVSDPASATKRHKRHKR